jgi:hypothetical protein
MGALNPFVAGVVLKLAAASKTAEIDSRAVERAIRSAQARVELFFCFFIELFGLNQFSCFSARFTGPFPTGYDMRRLHVFMTYVKSHFTDWRNSERGSGIKTALQGEVGEN